MRKLSVWRENSQSTACFVSSKLQSFTDGETVCVLELEVLVMRGVFWVFTGAIGFSLWRRSALVPCLTMRKLTKWGDFCPASSVYYSLKPQSFTEGRSVSDLKLESSTRDVFWAISYFVRSFLLLSAGTRSSGGWGIVALPYSPYDQNSSAMYADLVFANVQANVLLSIGVGGAAKISAV